MTLEEAMKRLGNLAIHHRDDTFHENEEAIKLSIEALKRVKSQRADKRFMASMLLPGETEV